MKTNTVTVETKQKTNDDLVILHEPLVKRIAYHLMSRLPPSVQADDLIQAGMIGLIEASRNFDPEQGASFATYAGIRIRGAMLDEIRRTDWTPRSVHRKAREVADAVRKIENEKGRDARDIEVAEAMGLELTEYHKILQDATGCRIFSFDDPGALGCSGNVNPERQANQPLESLQHGDSSKAWQRRSRDYLNVNAWSWRCTTTKNSICVRLARYSVSVNPGYARYTDRP